MDGVFVTLRSNESRAIIGLVDELARLCLDPVELECEPATRYVLTEIVRKGYATHGANGLPVPMRGARVR